MLWLTKHYSISTLLYYPRSQLRQFLSQSLLVRQFSISAHRGSSFYSLSPSWFYSISTLYSSILSQVSVETVLSQSLLVRQFFIPSIPGLSWDSFLYWPIGAVSFILFPPLGFHTFITMLWLSKHYSISTLYSPIDLSPSWWGSFIPSTRSTMRRAAGRQNDRCGWLRKMRHGNVFPGFCSECLP